MLTNYQKWRAYTEGLSSPDSFIDWSWRFVVSASLQRRVAFGADPKRGHMALFPNMYIVLVGKAGVGKGIVINPALELLRFHKKKDFSMINANTPDKEKLVLSKIEEANQDDANSSMTKMQGGGEKIDPTLFPYAPDATTYEALVNSMAKSGRRINMIDTSDKDNHKMDIYYHCSMYFGLPELGSLLRKRTDDTVNYLLGLYDCPLDYEYKTKTKGEDRVRRGCLNLLAGTTPEFMETIFDQKLIDQGFSSRAFLIYSAKNRKHVFTPPPLTAEQQQYRLDLLAHIKELAKLYGEVTVSKETTDWLQKWWEKENEDECQLSPKLMAYKARKNIHLKKVAMAEHFSESLSLHMELESFIRADEILKKEEQTMHVALTFQGANPLGKISDEVIDYLRMKGKKGATIVDLVADFWKKLPQGKKSMEEILEYLLGNDSGVVQDADEDAITGKVYNKYKFKI